MMIGCESKRLNERIVTLNENNKIEGAVVINATNLVVSVCRELHHHHPRQFHRRLRSRHMCPRGVQKQGQDQT